MRARRRSLTVVVVDDSMPVRQAFRSAFQAIPGVRVVGEAADTATALRLIGDLRPDVVTLDLQLARGYGTDVLRRIRASDCTPKPVIVVLTNHVEAFVRAACLDLGAHYFFDKASEFGAACDAIGGLAADRRGGECSHG